MELVAIVIVGAVIYFLMKDSSAKAKAIEQLSYENRSLKSDSKANDLELYMQAREKYQIVVREKQYYEKQYKDLLAQKAGVCEQTQVENSNKAGQNQGDDYEQKYFALKALYEKLVKETSDLHENYRTAAEFIKKYSSISTDTQKIFDIGEMERQSSERLEIFNNMVRNKQVELETREKELENRTKRLEIFVKKKTEDADVVARDAALIKKLCDEQIRAIPWMAGLYSDYIEARTSEVGDYLLAKKNPAYKAADLVKEVAKEQRKWAQAAKLYQYTTNYYESLIPWLTELLDFSVEEELPELNQTSTGEQEDPAKKWLSPEEYRKLPTVERNQLSLDRYLGRKKKTKREIGREYERYIGYCYEKDGYKVQYRGIIDGFEDLGRDLICINSDHVVIVQCKCWSADKVIREKHVNQLYGTSVMYAVENGLNGGQEGLFDPKHGKVRTRLITSTELSPVARKFADYLGVEYEENHKHGEYPVVKCNINRQTNEKIYHLPFDQLYDRVDVEKERGELFAWTVKEAEDAGFRRAMRWHG